MLLCIMESKHIIKISENYLLINKINTAYMQCERVSLGLSLYLKEEYGIENKIVKADIDIIRFSGCVEKYHLEDCEELEHHFIKIGSKILDATASQFIGMPKIYYGSTPTWYKLT